MSLLMKALEKAAKDRGETDAERAARAASGAATITPGAAPLPPSATPGDAPIKPSAGKPVSDLSLEPLVQQRITAAGAAAREPAMPPRTPAGAAPGTTPTPQSVQAAELMRASRRDAGGGGIGAYMREHPLLVFGALVVLFLAAYGTYVYLQITNPGMFVRQPARPAQSTPAPITQAPSAAASDNTAATAQPPVALTSLLPPLLAGAEQEKPAPQPSVAAAAGAAGNAAVAPAPAAPAPAPAPAPASAPRAPRDTIKVTVGGALPTINPTLAEAYQSLNTGNLDTSQQLYNQLLRSDPNNVDALLGLAAIATQQSNSAQASRHYLRILEVEPRNALAQAGLIGMLGRADPLAAESRLKQLIAHEPSAFLYFTLGNVYADQDRWPDAQQAYFQAYHLQPGNPDYAYNLAVGLEHIGQPKLALNYYRGALQLATTGKVNFNTAAVQERISKLEKTVQ